MRLSAWPGGRPLSPVPNVVSQTRFFAGPEKEACILMELFLFFLLPLPLPPVWGLGVDPALQIDVLTELELGESTTGVRQVPGLHNGTKAFLFQGMKSLRSPRAGLVHISPGVSSPLLCTASWVVGSELRCGGVSMKGTHLPSLFKWLGFSRLPPPAPSLLCTLASSNG